MKINIIAAVSKNGVIGNKGKIPWHIPEDLELFKQKTKGHAVIMGRKTWESIHGTLTGRDVIVLSRQTHTSKDGWNSLSMDLENALLCADRNGHKEAWICGGSRVYAEALRFADELHLTSIDEYVDGDAFFPMPFIAVDYEFTEGIELCEYNGNPVFAEVLRRKK